MKDIQQYKKFPALVSLLNILNENADIDQEKLILKIIQQYDFLIKNISLSNLSSEEKIYLLDLVKFNFINKRINSQYIKEKYQSFLKNYIKAKWRDWNFSYAVRNKL